MEIGSDGNLYPIFRRIKYPFILSYNSLIRAFGLTTEEPICKQEIQLALNVIRPSLTSKFELQFFNLLREIKAGIHISPILAFFEDFSSLHIPYEDEDESLREQEFTYIVFFKESDIIFYDGETVSVTEFYLPDKNELNKVRNFLDKTYNSLIKSSPTFEDFLVNNESLLLKEKFNINNFKEEE